MVKFKYRSGDFVYFYVKLRNFTSIYVILCKNRQNLHPCMNKVILFILLF